MVPASISWRGVSTNTVSLGNARRWTTNFLVVCSGTLQIAVSTLYVHGLFALLSSKSSTVLSRLSLNQAHWPLELQALNLAGCRNSWNSAPLAFQLLWGFVYPCTSLCVNLSLALLHECSYLLTTAAMTCFSPKPCLHISTFFIVAFSLPLVVEYVLPVLRATSGVLRMIW